mmetsp:Transcript_56386/g.132884  ORF Transcript_56386/g.132884 Transcript_56386/m.132884 type:complete len:103 (+) Transcript_56386:332-640(+)
MALVLREATFTTLTEVAMELVLLGADAHTAVFIAVAALWATTQLVVERVDLACPFAKLFILSSINEQHGGGDGTSEFPSDSSSDRSPSERFSDHPSRSSSSS